MTIEEFLVNTPPNKEEVVECDTDETEAFRARPFYAINIQPTKLHCPVCEGERTFDSYKILEYRINSPKFNYIFSNCRDCKKYQKIYSLLITLQTKTQLKILKLGEYPVFGPHTPPKLISLIGPDKNIFLTGRRAENQGMGIGAYTYYRRVVENQKNRIITELIKAMKKISIDKAVIEKFEDAKNETQFSKAMEMVKDVFPKALMIEGHNPFTLLHDALSNGLHAKTDEECLTLATNIRIVLAELASRIHELSKENSELKEAVSSLMKKK